MEFSKGQLLGQLERFYDEGVVFDDAGCETDNVVVMPGELEKLRILIAIEAPFVLEDGNDVSEEGNDTRYEYFRDVLLGIYTDLFMVQLDKRKFKNVDEKIMRQFVIAMLSGETTIYLGNGLTDDELEFCRFAKEALKKGDYLR